MLKHANALPQLFATLRQDGANKVLASARRSLCRPACLPARHRHCSRHAGAVRLGRRLGPDGRGDTAEATQLQRPQALVHATERWSRAAQHRRG